LILALAIAVRSLTASFLRAHFDDPGWFQFGSYVVFDRQAQNILDHKEPMFWINDSSRTDQIIYPPGYPLWVAAIYGATGDRSPVAVQRVQLVLDSLAVLLLVGIGATAFRWSIGIAAGKFSRKSVANLLDSTFDKERIAKKELPYERLDQLTVGILLGVR